MYLFKAFEKCRTCNPVQEMVCWCQDVDRLLVKCWLGLLTGTVESKLMHGDLEKYYSINYERQCINMWSMFHAALKDGACATTTSASCLLLCSIWVVCMYRAVWNCSHLNATKESCLPPRFFVHWLVEGWSWNYLYSITLCNCECGQDVVGHVPSDSILYPTWSLRGANSSTTGGLWTLPRHWKCLQ